MSSQNSFGKALASAEKSVRDKAVKKLSKYLSHKKDLSDLDLLKLWKGLFYCFWMSDKPLIQQQLSEKLASLILKIPNEIALKYVVAFWKEIRLEWNGVDRLRLDKFYYLFRQMHLNTFKYLEKVQWDINYVMKYIDIFTDGPLSMLDQTVPPSLLYHTCEVFVQELEKAITKPVPTSVFIDVLEPFFDVVGFCSNDILVEKVNEEIFLNIINIYENEDATGEEESNVLKSCDFKAIYERLEKLSGEPLVLKKNLEHIESLIVIFKGLAETQEVLQDEEENEEEEEEQEEIEEEKAAQKEENNDIEIIDKEVKEVEVKPSAKKGRPKGKKAATTPKGKKTNNKKKEEEPKPIEIDDEEEKPKNKNQKKRKAETEAKPIEIDGASKEKNDDEVEVIESSPKKRRKNAPKATATAKKNTKAKGKGAKAKAKEETEPESESVIVINESDDDKKQKQSEPKVDKNIKKSKKKLSKDETSESKSSKSSSTKNKNKIKTKTKTKSTSTSTTTSNSNSIPVNKDKKIKTSKSREEGRRIDHDSLLEIQTSKPNIENNKGSTLSTNEPHSKSISIISTSPTTNSLPLSPSPLESSKTKTSKTSKTKTSKTKTKDKTKAKSKINNTTTDITTATATTTTTSTPPTKIPDDEEISNIISTLSEKSSKKKLKKLNIKESTDSLDLTKVANKTIKKSKKKKSSKKNKKKEDQLSPEEEKFLNKILTETHLIGDHSTHHTLTSTTTTSSHPSSTEKIPEKIKIDSLISPTTTNNIQPVLVTKGRRRSRAVDFF